MRRTTGKQLGIGLAFLLGVLLLSGCETVRQRQQRMAQSREDMLLLREENRRLAGRVEQLALDLDYVQSELPGVKQDAAQSAQDGIRPLSGRVESLEERVQGLEAARQKDRDEVIDILSKKMAALMATEGGGGSRSRSGGYGYEHSVKSGETLSEIGAAYGVSVKVIIKENNLKNPNRLQVGQVLFIPK